MSQPFLAIDHMLRPGIPLLSQQRSKDPALGGHRIYSVLHHREHAGGDSAERAVSAGGDTDGVLDLFPGEMESAAGDNGRDESSERSVMPSALANTGKGGFAQPHFELVAEHHTDDQFLAVAA